MSINTNALYHWVKESTRNTRLKNNTLTISERVQRLLDKEEPLHEEKILYRVHSADSPVIVPNRWFSTSSDVKRVIEQHCSSKGGCNVFKIHIKPGIRVLDVDDTLKKVGKFTGFHEKEIIVNGGGQFTHPKSENGFYMIDEKNGITTIETYYQPHKKAEVTMSRNEKAVFEAISPEEYEYISSPENVKSSFEYGNARSSTNNIYKRVYEHIEELKKTSGGTRKRRTKYNRYTRRKNKNKKQKQ